MSRKHYIATAEIISAEIAVTRDKACAEEIARALRNVTLSLADTFKRDNPRFDRDRFYAAAGIERYLPAGGSAAVARAH